MRKLHISNTPPQQSRKGERRVFDNRKHGKITIGNNTFYCRSSWEANVAAYFEMQKKESKIKNWEYEPETFWFLKIMRGIRSYKPDFRITNNDGLIYYVEVKGFMDRKSMTKLKRMAKYHPKIIMQVIDAEPYKQISALREFIPDWGKLD